MANCTPSSKPASSSPSQQFPTNTAGAPVSFRSLSMSFLSGKEDTPPPKADSTVALSSMAFSPTRDSDEETLPVVANERSDCTVQGKIKFDHDDTPGRNWVVTLSLPQSCRDFFKWELSFTVETKQAYGPPEEAGWEWDKPCRHQVSCVWKAEPNEEPGTVVEALRASISHQGSPFLKFLDEAECTKPYYTALVHKIAELCEGSLKNAQDFQLSPVKSKPT